MSSSERHHAEMVAAHGTADGHTCGECAHCVQRRRPHPSRADGVAICVCLKAPTRTTGHGEIKRCKWTKRLPACGLFRAEA